MKKGKEVTTLKPYGCYYSQQMEFQINPRNRTCESHLPSHSWDKNDILKHIEILSAFFLPKCYL